MRRSFDGRARMTGEFWKGFLLGVIASLAGSIMGALIFSLGGPV